LDDTGLYYFNSRYYDAEIGRFISPDTFVPWSTGVNVISNSLTVNVIPAGLGSVLAPQGIYPSTSPSVPINPQALNRYSYVFNNPLKYVDTTGEIGLLAAIIIGAEIVGILVGVLQCSLPIWQEIQSPTPPKPEPPREETEPNLPIEREPTPSVSDRVTAPQPLELIPDIDDDWWEPDPQPEWHAQPESDSPTSSSSDQESESDASDDIYDDDYYWDYYWDEWYWDEYWY
jgi:hypothetical protein